MAKEKKGVRLEHISKIYKDPKTGKDSRRCSSTMACPISPTTR